ncbi:unnamed protein product [marine sediment metagenome]|uniref:Uncharacterized protein n=1 Tax=marine sediment metagenome TaxID=412755 RepID=X1D0S1_9ZZZZ
MRTKIYLDGKMKADLPETKDMDKFMSILRIFYFDGNWKILEIRKEENKKCVKTRNVSNTKHPIDADKA